MTILHVFPDDKFFDNVSNYFDKLPNVNNIYPFYSPEAHKFVYIKSITKVHVINDFKLYTNEFSRQDVDIIYFHSLPPYFYRLFKYIPKSKKIIWWAWGYDIYYGNGICPPLIKLNLYKPITLQHIKSQPKSIYFYFKILYYVLTVPYYYLIRRKAINRIGWFSPVIPVEYDLMKSQCKFFHAKPFMLRVGPGFSDISSFQYYNSTGNILIGNSLTFTNNHLDIFNILKKIKMADSTKIIVPINYGTDFKDIENFKKMSDLGDKAFWIESFLPYDEYMKIIGSCTHAIFGVLRQQALGNINACMQRGVKVFLYRDSILYQYFKESGYKIFAIDEIDEDQLRIPLSREDAYVNYRLIYERNNNTLDYCYRELLNVINS